MAAIKGTIVPLLAETYGDCQICLSKQVVLLTFPCCDDHRFCEGCLLKSWERVGALRCPVCRQDVQQC
eukprot:3483831-Lingulodinium_polyedra.AAC.1